MKIQFTDLKAQFAVMRDDIRSAIDRVLEHGQFIMGPEVLELESKLAEFVGVKHAIACSSGTDALLVPLMAYGVGPGDAVLTTPFTFIATSEVLSLLGATPVFVDVDRNTFNIDPALLDKRVQALRKEGRLRVRGVIAVDLFGLPADYAAIKQIAAQHDLFVIEDAAQSLGGTYSGKKAGGLADVGATSFFPSKPLGCYGDGGAIFTNHDGLAQTMRSIRVHGQGNNKYDNVRVGLNARLDTLQAAILLQKLKRFPDEIAARNQIAQRYSQALSKSVGVPRIPQGSLSAWAQYSITTPHRDQLQKHLQEAQIPSAVYYPKPLHLQEAYARKGSPPESLPVAEELSRTILSLPMHPYLTAEQQDSIVETVKGGV